MRTGDLELRRYTSRPAGAALLDQHSQGPDAGERRAIGVRFPIAGRSRPGYASGMADVTQILSSIEAGDPNAAEELLPLVYDELRKLAAARLADEKPGQTLQPTALVHEAYVRLVGGNQPQDWNGRGHFFAAAAEAMRRILVEAARHKGRERHGGGRSPRPLDGVDAAAPSRDDDLVALSEALDRLAAVNPRAAELVKLRYFAGLTGREAAGVLGISPRKADQVWAYARTWLLECLGGHP
jgi:RNA polymerase sigma factor (TIGR02999 family)